MIIFCDGVFDLFHYGHVNHFKNIKLLYPDSKLIVGIMKDNDASSYKRKPIFNENKRLSLVESCKYVDQVILEYPSILTTEFIDNNNIDLVIHAFSNDEDYNKQLKYFDIPIKLNKFKRIDYNHGISTSNIINDFKKFDTSKNGWDLIWELKGDNDNNDALELNGYEETKININDTFTNIISNLNINLNDKIIEFGCGAGVFSNLFNNNYDYYGIDYSFNLIKKNIKLFNSKVYNCEANNTPFKDKFFDYAFCIGVFEYFPTKEYALQVINEMKRVSKKGIYILNIRSKTHQQKLNKHKLDGVFQHIIYNHNDFKDFEILDSTYEHDNRFSIIKLNL